MRTSLLFLFALPLAAQSLKLPEGPGKDTTQRLCGSCHGAEIMMGRQESREAWGAVVNDMIQRGATGSEEEFFQVVDYLSAHFSPDAPATKINVNEATAKDLQTTLRLPEKQATAIIEQRTAKGNYKSIEDLEKVPGIDTKKIEANKNRLAF